MSTPSQQGRIERLERHLNRLARLVRAKRYRQSLERVISIDTARNRCGVN